MNIRRILMVVGFIALVIFFAWALYFFIFSGVVVGPGGQRTNVNNTNGTLPNINGGVPQINVNQNGNSSLPNFPTGTTQPDEIASGSLTLVDDYGTLPVVEPIGGAQGITYFDTNSNSFVRLDSTGQSQKISNTLFYDVQNVIWTPDQSRAIIEYPDGANIVYDFTTNKQVSLPRELENFSIDSSGTGLVAVWDGGSPENTWLMAGDINGGNFQLIEPVGDNKAGLEVSISPDNQVVGLFRQSAGIDKQEIIPIGRNQENFNSFTVDGVNFESKWSPTGDTLLYNVSKQEDGFKPRLWLTNGKSGSLGYSQTNLQLNTWADKCTFNSTGSSLYCAAPVSLEDGAGLFRDLANNSTDVFYRIDLISGTRIPLAIPVGSEDSYNAQNLFLSSDSSVLYFVDANTNRLHSIRLQ